MRYKDLSELIRGSSSSRRFFLSRSVPMQMELHKHNDFIHSAAELRELTAVMEKYCRSVEISEALFKKD